MGQPAIGSFWPVPATPVAAVSAPAAHAAQPVPLAPPQTPMQLSTVATATQFTPAVGSPHFASPLSQPWQGGLGLVAVTPILPSHSAQYFTPNSCLGAPGAFAGAAPVVDRAMQGQLQRRAHTAAATAPRAHPRWPARRGMCHWPWRTSPRTLGRRLRPCVRAS